MYGDSFTDLPSDDIVVKLDVSRGYVIRRLVEEGIEKYYSNNKQVVGSNLDPLSI